MSDDDMAAVLAPVERNYLRNPERITCPQCSGVGTFPAGVLTEEPTDCPLCCGSGHVGREVWLDFLADDFTDRRPGR